MNELPEDVVKMLIEATGYDPAPMIRGFVQFWDVKETRPRAIRFAHRFYEQYRDALFPYLAALRREELVALVSRYRAEKRETERVITDMWLMGRFPPPRVLGVFRTGE